MNKQAKVSLVIILALVLVLAVGFAIAKPGDRGKPVKECNDDIDNDGDNATDWPADAGCDNKNDNDETNCGDAVCEGGETSVTCPEDCGIPDSCSDSDGGYNIFVLGNVSGYLDENSYTYWDFCSTNTSLIEYACSGNYAYNYTVDCTINATSCSSGACI
jgi:hypothetical protein